jgi:hypothetical protein
MPAPCERTLARLRSHGLYAVGVDCLAVLIDGTVEVVPATTDRDIRLVHSPRRSDRSRESTPALLVLRDVTQYPSKDCGVGDLNAALGHDLDQVSIGEAVADVPADAQLDDLGVEYSPPINSVSRNRLSHTEPREGPLCYRWPRMHQSQRVRERRIQQCIARVRAAGRDDRVAIIGDRDVLHVRHA